MSAAGMFCANTRLTVRHLSTGCRLTVPCSLQAPATQQLTRTVSHVALLNPAACRQDAVARISLANLLCKSARTSFTTAPCSLDLEQAHKAAEQHEVPVGAVLVLDGTVVAAAHNETETTGNPVAHAEMLCIQQAALKLEGWRLLQCTLYVTLEPCPMCAGALLQSRVGTVVYGARNTLLGADGSWISLLSHNSEGQAGDVTYQKPHPFHPSLQVRRGVLAKECSKLMQDFFRSRRLGSLKTEK